MSCLELLAEERVEYIKRKMLLKEDKIKEIERVYKARDVSNKLFKSL